MYYKPDKHRRTFIVIISLFLFSLGFYGYQVLDGYLSSVKTTKVVSFKGDEVRMRHIKPDEVHQSDDPYPVTNNKWTDGKDTYLYLGNRLVQERDFRFRYNGLEQYLYIDGDVQDEDVIDSFTKIICYTPENVLNAFISKNGEFIFCGERSLFDYYKEFYTDDKSAWDSFYSEEYSIDAFLYNKDGDYKICCKNDEDAVIRSLLHEMGHFVDAEKQMVSSDEKFLQIYTDEAPGSELGDYATSSSDEFFAESFQQMLVDPTYKDRCPQTCEYIERCYRSI